MWNLRAKTTPSRDTLNVFSSIILDAFNISQSPIVNKITHSLSERRPYMILETPWAHKIRTLYLKNLIYITQGNIITFTSFTIPKQKETQYYLLSCITLSASKGFDLLIMNRIHYMPPTKSLIGSHKYHRLFIARVCWKSQGRLVSGYSSLEEGIRRVSPLRDGT